MSRTPSLTIANDATITGLIQSANRRVIYMAPGMSDVVSQAIEERLRALGPEAIMVIVDVDPEVCRLGYGQIEALRSLEATARQLGAMVHSQPGIRIGLVIADDQTLFYSPTPLLVEASPDESSRQVKPNAIRLGLPPADVERDLGLGPDGIAERTLGLDKAQRMHIEAAAKELAANPPQRFDIARSVRVFNANFEFVELSITGLAMDRKRIKIPSDLLGLGSKDDSIQHALRMTLGLVDRKHCAAIKRLHRIRNWISRRFLTQLPGYGNIVSTIDKPMLILAVERLEKLAVRLHRQVLSDLQRELEQKHTAMMEMLLPLIQRSRPQRWRHWSFDPKDDERRLAVELGRIFGAAEHLMSKLEVRLVFKGATYETLIDPAFIALVQKRLPELTQLHEEQFAAMSMPAKQESQDHQLKGAA